MLWRVSLQLHFCYALSVQMLQFLLSVACVDVVIEHAESAVEVMYYSLAGYHVVLVAMYHHKNN